MRRNFGMLAAALAFGANVIGGTGSASEAPTPTVRNKHARVRRDLDGRVLYRSGAIDRSKYMPHQGKQEIARRLRQAERLAAKQYEANKWRKGRYNVSSFSVTVGEETFELGRGEIQIIPKTPIGTELMTSDKPIGEVQDSGNPVGKKVSWVSSNVEKTGEITHVVPAGKIPSDVGAKVKDAGTPRDHESFVVFGGTADGRSTYYWPRASLLKFA